MGVSMPKPRLTVLLSAALFGGFLALASGGASAAVVTFFGQDGGIGAADPRPSSDAAAASFDVAIGAIGTIRRIDFESSPVGFTNPFSPLAGVSVSFANADP